MWTAILTFLGNLLGIIPKAPTAEATAEATGETAGAAKTENAAAQVTIQDVKTAQAVRQQVQAETTAEAKAGAPPADDGFERD